MAKILTHGMVKGFLKISFIRRLRRGIHRGSVAERIAANTFSRKSVSRGRCNSLPFQGGMNSDATPHEELRNKDKITWTSSLAHNRNRTLPRIQSSEQD